MPYRSRSHFRRRRRLVQRTPQQQAAFDARLAGALQLYVSEAVYKGPPIGAIAAGSLAIAIALTVWIIAR